jgi:hypothetical protein
MFANDSDALSLLESNFGSFRIQIYANFELTRYAVMSGDSSPLILFKSMSKCQVRAVRNACKKWFSSLQGKDNLAARIAIISPLEEVFELTLTLGATAVE